MYKKTYLYHFKGLITKPAYLEKQLFQVHTLKTEKNNWIEELF